MLFRSIKKKCKKCGKNGKADTDVFDTWMTSSNSPELAGKWLEKPDVYKKVVPMSLRPQSHDIIRTWAFYTILKSHLLFNRLPWKDVMIGTYVLDEKGKGMHKSKGNAVWADELIEKYNIDAFRYWVGSASVGSDLPFKEQELVAGKRFLTKLWNASNFVFMNLKGNVKKPRKLEKIDSYFLIKLSKLLKKAKENYEKYDIAGVKRESENFFWKDFADNYLEIVKNRIYNGSKSEKDSAKYVLYESLLSILKIFSPICPFITEEIYSQKFAKDEKKKSIHISDWPELDFKLKNKEEEAGDLFIKILQQIRQVKAKNKKSVKAEIILSLENKIIGKLDGMLQDLKAVVNAKEIKTGKFKVEFV